MIKKMYSVLILSGFSASFGISLTSVNYLDSDDSHNVSDKFYTFALASIFLGAIVSNYYSAKTSISKKMLSCFSNLFLILGYLLILFLDHPVAIIFGRLLIGAAIGIINSIVPVWISSLAPSKYTGTFKNLHALGISIGVVFGLILNLLLSFPEIYHVILAYSILHTFMLFLLTEFKEERKDNEMISVKKLIRNNKAKISISLLVFLHAGQHLSGINHVILFMNRIFNDPKIGILFNILSSLVTFISSPFTDMFGRKSLILSSVGGILISLGLFISNLSDHLAILLYILSFNCGLNSIPWSIADEIFEKDYIRTGALIGSTVNYLFAFSSILLVSYLHDALGRWAFLIYFISMLLLFTFLAKMFKETKRKIMVFQ